jgi:hemoglobin
VGKLVVEAFVDRLYELLLGEERLARCFEGADMALLKRHQVQLVTQLLGGPATFDQRNLRLAYARMGLARSDHENVRSYLVQVLVEKGLKPAVIGRLRDALARLDRGVVPLGAMTT